VAEHGANNMTSVKIIEQGNGFSGVRVGAELYDGEDLVVVTALSRTIQTTGAGEGNWLAAEVEMASRDITQLSDAEFAALPQVLVRAVQS
jgi:hypothetical protein